VKFPAVIVRFLRLWLFRLWHCGAVSLSLKEVFLEHTVSHFCIVDVAFDEHWWIRVQKNPHSSSLCDRVVGLPLDHRIGAAAKGLYPDFSPKLEDFGPYDFYLRVYNYCCLDLFLIVFLWIWTVNMFLHRLIVWFMKNYLLILIFWDGGCMLFSFGYCDIVNYWFICIILSHVCHLVSLICLLFSKLNL